MPTCCPSTVIPFSNQSISTIPYTLLMRQQYGPMPRVHVWYLDAETNEYYLSNAFLTRTAFIAGNIIIDHGGPAIGRIVIR